MQKRSDSPSWIFTRLPEKFCVAKKGSTPLVEFWWLPLSKLLALTPLVEKFWLSYLKKRSHSPSWILRPPPLKGFSIWPPKLKDFDSPTWRIFLCKKRSHSPSWILMPPPLKGFWFDSPSWKIFDSPSWILALAHVWLELAFSSPFHYGHSHIRPIVEIFRQNLPLNLFDDKGHKGCEI